jgi:hypothetical protein
LLLLHLPVSSIRRLVRRLLEPYTVSTGCKQSSSLHTAGCIGHIRFDLQNLLDRCILPVPRVAHIGRGQAEVHLLHSCPDSDRMKAQTRLVAPDGLAGHTAEVVGCTADRSAAGPVHLPSGEILTDSLDSPDPPKYA